MIQDWTKGDSDNMRWRQRQTQNKNYYSFGNRQLYSSKNDGGSMTASSYIQAAWNYFKSLR